MMAAVLSLVVFAPACGSDDTSGGADAAPRIDPTARADMMAAADAALPVDAGAVPQPDLAPDLAPAGSKGVGEHCTDGKECADEMICASGEYTSAHCTPRCDSTEQCNAAAPPAKGQCVPVGGFDGNICLWFCGMLADGADCPGDLSCEVAACR